MQYLKGTVNGQSNTEARCAFVDVVPVAENQPPRTTGLLLPSFAITRRFGQRKDHNLFPS